jgi:uncharacterized protein YndB with AHSA1/START domain
MAALKHPIQGTTARTGFRRCAAFRSMEGGGRACYRRSQSRAAHRPPPRKGRTMDENAQRVDRGSLLISAPPSTVYRALTDPESLEKWLPPEGMVARVEHFAPGIGGGFSMVLTYLDASGRGKTSETTDVTNVEFVDLVPDRRIVQHVRFTSDDAGFAGTMTMTWELRAEPEGTLVSVAATNVPPGISPADHEAGLASSLANLAAHLERGTGPG